ncbi:MAG: hypothetical protein IKW49_03270 [Opitutales bacterium]|nr:hypothetical protein [Opitutales bacterium]
MKYKRIIIIFFSSALAVVAATILWYGKANNQNLEGNQQIRAKPSTISSRSNEVYPRDKASLVKADWAILGPKIIPVCERGEIGPGDIKLRDWNNKPLKEFPHAPTCNDVLQSLAWCVSYYHVPNVCIEDENYFYAWYAGEPFQGNIIDKKHFRRRGWEIKDGQLRIIGARRAEATADGSP